ncbi:nucleoid occlusion protein [Effusibacillus dendaii]|uniref:Nucleoid occlusion protein n=2 Tax=Effusibacillus dendaii TaxID=2743772 RepID=A0A7I8DFY3_9BACL|nr:nucleoid occlusion protein [Effusibacillus dendaii]
MKDQLSRIFGIADKELSGAGSEEVKQLPIDSIQPNRYQPRSVFDDERIDELSQTIRTHGLIQPIVVRRNGSGYELIAGERRWRAAKKLGLNQIPAIVRELSDVQAASVALIENLQREGLSAIEEAYAYQKLQELHGLTQESLAQRLGKAQSTVANKLRLLNLPEEVHQALLTRQITERHARAMLSLPTAELQLKVLAEVIDKQWNVKQTELRIEKLLEMENPKKKARKVSFSKDVRLALNTIRQSMDMIRKTGISLETEEHDHADYYQIVIRVPK